MGLGKTLQIIALALCDKDKTPRGIPVRSRNLHEQETDVSSQYDADESDSDESLASSYYSHRTKGPHLSAASSSDTESDLSSDTQDSENESVPPRKIVRMTASPAPRKTTRDVKGKAKAKVYLPSDDNVADHRDKKSLASARGLSKTHSEPFNDATLVICPLSVLQNWVRLDCFQTSPSICLALTLILRRFINRRTK